MYFPFVEMPDNLALDKRKGGAGGGGGGGAGGAGGGGAGGGAGVGGGTGLDNGGMDGAIQDPNQQTLPPDFDAPNPTVDSLPSPSPSSRPINDPIAQTGAVKRSLIIPSGDRNRSGTEYGWGGGSVHSIPPGSLFAGRTEGGGTRDQIYGSRFARFSTPYSTLHD